MVLLMAMGEEDHFPSRHLYLINLHLHRKPHGPILLIKSLRPSLYTNDSDLRSYPRDLNNVMVPLR